MKALYKPAAQPGLELVERPEPDAGPGEVKIRVLRTGICGTDLHIEAWDDWAAGAVDAPLIVGHEFCGEVVAVGARVRDVRVGDQVSGEGHIVCGTCRNCRAGRRHLCIRTESVGVNRDGAFAEYVVLPESNVWVHHVPLDPDLGAIFDPFGNAVHTALTFPLVGEDVLITGAGPIGLMAAAVVRHVGARYVVITDISESRLQLARGLGVDLALNVTTESIGSAQKFRTSRPFARTRAACGDESSRSSLNKPASRISASVACSSSRVAPYIPAPYCVQSMTTLPRSAARAAANASAQNDAGNRSVTTEVIAFCNSAPWRNIALIAYQVSNICRP